MYISALSLSYIIYDRDSRNCFYNLIPALSINHLPKNILPGIPKFMPASGANFSIQNIKPERPHGKHFKRREMLGFNNKVYSSLSIYKRNLHSSGLQYLPRKAGLLKCCQTTECQNITEWMGNVHSARAAHCY